MNQYQAELYHHGIKGQKWGIRRFQNPDGSLTSAGQKRYSKLYKSEMRKLGEDLAKSESHRFVTAHNMTSHDWNYNGKMKEFNDKYGGKKIDEQVIKIYDELFSADRQKNYSKILIHDIEHNEHYQKAKELCDNYKLLDYDTLAQKYATDIEKLRKSIG